MKYLKSFILSLCFLPLYSQAAFESRQVPVSIYHLACDGNPRIVVSFGDGVPNIWYPAQATYADRFYTAAITAQTTGKKLYYYGDDATVTPYCVAQGRARAVSLFGVE